MDEDLTIMYTDFKLVLEASSRTRINITGIVVQNLPSPMRITSSPYQIAALPS